MILLLLLATTSCASAWSYAQNFTANVSITIDPTVQYQRMVGGGCSGAFGIACQQFGSVGLSPAKQEEVTQILFDENIGGLSIVRNDIGSSVNNSDGRVGSILPECPATPYGPFNYVWDGNDTCQLQLTQTALKYNPDLFVYADAWSAPGCMKTVGTDSDGGFICGVRGSNCTADWRQAYADYLVQYVKFYQQEGIKISLLGAYNEPDFNPITYSSMLSDGYQAHDFLSLLYPTAKAAFPNLSIACCDATGARQERNILSELTAAGGANDFDIATWHNYQSNPERPFNVPSGQPNIMTEWADGTGLWNPYWDVAGQLAEGFQWALYMHNAFVNSDTSGYVHWWCAQNTTGDNALIRLQYDEYFVSARLWAFAGYLRFVREGAVRVEVQSSVEEVYVSAFVNGNGSVAVPVVNAAHFAYEASIDLGGLNVSMAQAYLTDNEHNVTLTDEWAVKGGMLDVMVEPRAMKTFFLQ